jgi:site-specific DNA-methyltransferase (adenine-specific)
VSGRSFLDGRVILHCGDCLDALAAMPENSVDSVVCDPPYHLTSIVKRFGTEGAAEAKSGATGAFKRASAGFMGKQWDGGDIAFQPSTWAAVLRVLKPGGYLLAFASTRGIWRMGVAIEDAGFINHPMFGWIFGSGFPKATRVKADGYEGFRYGGQASKPAIEPIYMGQKPFSEATGTANILRWGTGAVNIDGCRVGEGVLRSTGNGQRERSDGYGMQGGIIGGSELGRWPANVIHDGSEEVLAAFDEFGVRTSGSWDGQRTKDKENAVYGKFGTDADAPTAGSSGSAARFFYSAKADAEDRLGSKHPTVKPLDLMQYLVRLVTPPGGTVLDCFAGTGTTGEAAFREGMKAILIEREPEYQDDIARRMELAQNPTKRAAVAKTKNNLQGAEGTPLFGGVGMESAGGASRLREVRTGRTIGPVGLKR